MKKYALLAATAALTTVSTGASAAYVSQIDALSGKFAVSGFADGTPLTYQVSLTELTGSGALPAVSTETMPSRLMVIDKALSGMVMAGDSG